MTKTRFFSNVKTLDELKKLYRELAQKLHPDKGGSTEDMKALNAEYDEVFKRVKNFRTAASGEVYESENAEAPEDFREVIEKIIMLNIKIEICGSWIWVTGNTYPVRGQLKEAGFYWSKNKSAWYWHSPENASRSRKRMSLDEIRAFHGSQVVKGAQYITA